MESSTWRPGLAWKNDKFYSFDIHSALVMRMWPEMRAWRRTKTLPWSPTRKWADRLLCSEPLAPGLIESIQARKTTFVGPLEWIEANNRFVQDSEARLAAFSSIPDRERAAAARFLDRRWHLLALMARCRWATDLVEANPALGFALASNWILHKPAVAQPLRAARSLLNKRQLVIMDWLGFPATERVRRILMRIPPAALAARKLPQLNAALHRPHCQELLAHLPVISEPVLRFIYHEDTSRRLTSKFIHEVAEDRGSEKLDSDVLSVNYFGLWLDAIRMARELEYPRPQRLLSVGQLTRWHDEVSTAYNRRPRAVRLIERIEERHFDGAPFVGSPGIEPIRSGEELLEEGRVMHHCVASYHDQIAEGRYFVYRVTDPVRATLGVKKRKGRWVMHEIKGSHNKRIPSSDQDAIWEALTRPSVPHNLERASSSM